MATPPPSSKEDAAGAAARYGGGLQRQQVARSVREVTPRPRLYLGPLECV